MKNKVLVSIISDQTLPVVQMIKEFPGIQEHIFLSSDKVKDKEKWIIESTKINSEKVRSILINPYDPQEVTTKLNDNRDVFEEYEDVILNITGGTKLTTLAAYDFFKELGATIYYVTGYKDIYWKLFPNKGQRKLSLKTKVSLEEYLIAYGFLIDKKSQPKFDFETAKSIFNYFIKNGIKNNSKPLDILRNSRKKKNLNIDTLKREEQDILIKFNEDLPIKIINNENNIPKKLIKYLSGEWFEELLYYKTKEDLALSDDEIGLGAILKNKDVINEFDIIFTYNNKLFIIEAKTSVFIQSDDKKHSLLKDFIYKSEALKNNFGLFANSFIITLDSKEEINNANLERADLYRIKLLTIEDLYQNNKLVDFRTIIQ